MINKDNEKNYKYINNLPFPKDKTKKNYCFFHSDLFKTLNSLNMANKYVSYEIDGFFVFKWYCFKHKQQGAVFVTSVSTD